MTQTERAAERATQIAIPQVLTDADIAPSLVRLQASRLTRRYAITAAMAAIVAPFAFGEGVTS